MVTPVMARPMSKIRKAPTFPNDLTACILPSLNKLINSYKNHFYSLYMLIKPIFAWILSISRSLVS
jgi:hypothetical protein